MNDENQNKDENLSTDNNFIDKKLKDKTKDSGRKMAKKLAQMAIHAVIAIIHFIISHFLLIIVVAVVVAVVLAVFKWFLEDNAAEEVPKAIYSAMGIEDVSDLVTIQGNEEEGYHLEFVSDFDYRLEKAVEEINKTTDEVTIDNVEDLRTFIQAEVATQYPNLQGDTPEGIGVSSLEGSSGNSLSLSSTDKLLFLGDSITVGLIENCGSKFSNNYSIATVGHNSSQLLSDFESAKKPSEDKINGICIMIGVNGIYNPEGEANNAQKVIRRVHEEYPNKPIFFESVLPVNDKWTSQSSSVNNTNIDKYNSIMKEFCSKNSEAFNVTYIDVTSGLKNDSGKLDSNLSSDGLHPNATGYEKLAENIKSNVVQRNVTSNSNVDTKVTTTSTKVSAEAMSGDSVQQKIWNFFTSKGYSDYTVAGIMGNMQQESQFNSSAVNSAGPYYGLCQWGGGRYTQLCEYAASKNKDWTDVDCQIEFLYYEMQKDGGNGIATYQLEGQGYEAIDGKVYTVSDFINAKSTQVASDAFQCIFERYSGEYSERRAYASDWFEKFNGTGGTYTGNAEENAEKLLKSLTLQEKVSQMIMAITSSAEDLKQNVGGYVILYNSNDIKSDIEASKTYNRIPAIYSSDEEGGQVKQVLSGYQSQQYFGQNDSKLVSESKNKAKEMLSLGLNMNLAPVADVSDKDSYMGQDERSFGSDFNIASKCVQKVVGAFKENGLMSVLKHFPGYGNAKDTHPEDGEDDGRVYNEKNDITDDINVFKAGIDAGATAIMRGHFISTAIDSEKEASISTKVGKYIREQLDFDGIVMTDALNMGAITSQYNNLDELAVACVKAGNDMLMTEHVDTFVNAIVEAVENGEIKEETIDESVKRILKAKFEYGLIENSSSVNLPGDGRAFQGNIKIRRVMPDKDLGEMNEGLLTNAIVEENEEASNPETAINNYISNLDGSWSIYAKNLKDKNDVVRLNYDDKKQSASLIKLFIMATAYQKINDKVINENEVSEDLKLMITKSDNDATNRLIDKIGMQEIKNYIENNKYTGTEINRKMLAGTENGDNYTTVKDVATLLEKIYTGECVNREYSNKMLELLKNQTKKSKIPAGVPSGVETANKTGELDDVENDAAIIFKDDAPYILVIMSEKLEDTEKAVEDISKLSNMIYNIVGEDISDEYDVDDSDQMCYTDGVQSRVIDLSYVPEDVFNNYVTLGDSRALEVFTLNENKELVLANWSYNSTTGLSISGSNVIDYQNVIQKYTMPYEYPLFFLIDGEDKDFALNLANLAINSEFIIAVQDNVTTTETITEKQQVTNYYEGDILTGSSEPETVYYDKQINESSNVTIELTYADSWVVQFEKDVSYSEISSEYPGKVTDSGSQTGSSSNTSDKYLVEMVSNEYGYVNKYISYTTTTKTTTRTISNEYDSGDSSDAEVIDKTDKFVELYKNSEYAQYKIVTEWLFDMVKNNTKTSNMLELTKYLLYKATGTDYGAKNYDFSIYKDNEFIKAGGNGNISYESLNITSEDLEILYKITSAERGGGTQEQQEYVVSVILNRVLSSQFPNSVKEVVFAENQFEPTRNGAYEAANPSAVTKAAVKNVVENGDTSGGAVYFMTPAASLSQTWLSNCIFLFNDKDDSLRNTNTGGTHNFYTTKAVQDELKQYKADGASEKATEIIKIAKSKMGCSYVWGAHGPDTFDCTGFIEWVYRQAGITVPWYTEAYKSYQGTNKEVSLSEIQPGDILIVYNTEARGGIGHGAIYLGDDKYIHCSKNVHISTLSARQNGSEGSNPFRHAFRFW